MQTTRRKHSSRRRYSTKSSRTKTTHIQKIAEDPKARTMDGLNHWYVHVFKHFGWMVLEKSRGNQIKIESYKDTVNRLIQSLEFKLKEIHEKDKKEDLLIMIRNVKILKKTIEKEI